ncbi:restriction endonuclease [Tepidimicrobium xylanilyticum]|uniref:Restriction endonuclease n=1 Tax=Tepidimicrobium xylanilyticum TaxID=1123352 RepID=A0A1H2SUK6_9FIRM|nr:restriction endonuclease [Tepidimicrobium xylanilyticum]SDW34719.1 Restriction endonuclease [Tepidimicrobium xylanilyticum]
MKELLNFKDYFKRLRRQLILNSYYSNRIKDGKSIHASLIDWVFLIVGLTLFFLITIFNSTRRPILSIFLTFIVMGVFLVFLVVWKGRIRYKRIEEINEDVARKHIIKEVTKYNNRDFLAYIKELLEIYYNTKLIENSGHIGFTALINGEVYGVKCIKNSMEDRVSLKELRYFKEEMERQKLEEGIVITNSYFSEEVRDELDYLLIDFDGIIKMLKAVDRYPTKVEVEKMIIDGYKNKRGSIKEKFTFYERDRIYKFILLGLILYVISPFVSYTTYYRIMSFICICFGIIIGIYNLSTYMEKGKNDV